MNTVKCISAFFVLSLISQMTFAQNSNSPHRPSRFSPDLKLTYYKDVKAKKSCTLNISFNNIDKIGRPFYYEIRKIMLKKGFTVKENYGFDNVHPDGTITHDDVADFGEFWLAIDLQGTLEKSAELDVTRLSYPNSDHSIIQPSHGNVFHSDLITGIWRKSTLRAKVLDSLEKVGNCHF